MPPKGRQHRTTPGTRTKTRIRVRTSIGIEGTKGEINEEIDE
jgi:hypothetical protein